MSLIPPSMIESGSGGKSLPDGYSFTKNEASELELRYNGALVSRQSVDGSTFSESVKTGVGSFHLGDAHSVSSCGQNVGFLNEFDAADEGYKVFWFPVWQGLSKDGNIDKDPTALKFSANTSYDVNGAANPAKPNIPYNFTTSITSNMAVIKVQVIPNEAYTGKLTNLIKSNGVEVYRTDFDAVCVPGQSLNISYKYPFFTRAGDELTLQLIKEDGTFLNTWSGATNTNWPFRRLFGRQFSDLPLRPAIDGSTVDSGATIADADRFVHNDNGSMRQTSFTRVWAWIVGKITGSASSIITTDLTANRALISNSSKKVAVSAVTDTELGYLSGATSSIQGQLNAALRSRQNIGFKSLGNSTGDQTWATVVSYEGLKVEVRWDNTNCARIKNDTGSQVTVLWHQNGAIASSNESLADGAEKLFPSPANGNAMKYEFTAWRGEEMFWHGTFMMYKFSSGVRLVCDLAITQP